MEKLTERKVTFFSSVMDSAYDAAPVATYVSGKGRVPLINPNKRRGAERATFTPAQKDINPVHLVPAIVILPRVASCGICDFDDPNLKRLARIPVMIDVPNSSYACDYRYANVQLAALRAADTAGAPPRTNFVQPKR
jgi:hypothetical protein